MYNEEDEIIGFKEDEDAYGDLDEPMDPLEERDLETEDDGLGDSQY